jgi:hypothetical protein
VVEILALAADIDLAVDIGAAAAALTARQRDLAACRPGSGSVVNQDMNLGPPRKAKAGAMKVTMASGMRMMVFWALRSGPASTSATRILGSAERRLASTQPAAPAPTMT